MHASTALYVRGPYRVVANAQVDTDRPYVVLDTAGAWLHESVTLDDARDWVDRRISERERVPGIAVSARSRA
ncbi:hypothetical protein DWG18_12300 [Lysobacter sp. TY2-98]|uniref:hypothetical protein n=1 Tax=Lysobacter sp. TY2-98 TaxID=2290922 RepID=UPI000E20C837|nr:hypothetical protein [Lysobacter sp. TY2-98]AXK72983.1 hypothetical protein DWG18_12300 [Lysobacter sp. TY2-98]